MQSGTETDDVCNLPRAPAPAPADSDESLPAGKLPPRGLRLVDAEKPAENVDRDMKDPPRGFWAWELRGWRHLHTHTHQTDTTDFRSVLLCRDRK
jgi:hypothetical protein